ncbi:UDP-N-acetylglucosamine:LPS N-acetylglucosamine transferase [Paenibacillus sp. FSL R7-0273]|uniref:UDP-N-acetylglucosamine--LPS N-acetylglucosamine transferase n=1 Tax=Paenibacillus sp. FSL R7-0273 TaxID=1536772 RepID=UPI0004F8FB12|nr:UDP-N-acetylglucosamine--LPS N-acetylglucosamine transferase [Paenibacillus sp. FSL R7-0273]AIQ45282.1 UDP-N-acetylglucosamine:LPS N-acetylglucosamine transferase [Paenibacillus sp. FSL R7-0273]OMF88902.1 UDP-N-acetylglucosamine--LPS N-acetylglucosamine transferase [Paenibacillus sp. FSL R7-0273]
MRKKRVLLFSEGFGTGHTGAAYALAEGIRLLSPDVQCRVIELGKFLNPTVAPWILSAYRKTVSSQPKLVGMMYKTQYHKSLSRLTRAALHRVFYTRAKKVIEQLKPDLIICSHPIPAAVIARLKQQGLDVPLYTLITDYDAHASWVNPETDRYLVSTSRVKSVLTGRGVSPELVTVTGIPVHPKFWERSNKTLLRKELGLADIPTVLIMGGGWGLMFGQDVMDSLTARMDQIQLIFCMGSNDKLVARMRSTPLLNHPNVKILGYSNEINKLMDVSDLLITKPGGMTCTEGQAKGIPMLFYSAIPGQEEKNCQYFVELGLAEELNSRVVDKWFSMLLREYKGIEEQRRRRLAQERQQTHNCASAVLQLLGKTADVTAELRSTRAQARTEEAVYVTP